MPSAKPSPSAAAAGGLRLTLLGPSSQRPEGAPSFAGPGLGALAMSWRCSAANAMRETIAERVHCVRATP
eukprot:9477104-Pyramimonas_sp.AAC.2